MGCGASTSDCSNAKGAAPVAPIGKTLLGASPTTKDAAPTAVSFVELLGETLLTKGGEAKTAIALSGAKHVMLYFSAHWCPPCRGFTPQLAEAYQASGKAGSETMIVFVSSDRDENAFRDYYSQMPWFALPFAARDQKNSLSQKFGVQGIPSLVVLDGLGELVSDNGRAEYKSYLPASPPKPTSSGFVDLLGETLLTKDGEAKTETFLSKRSHVMLYFSAHWCPPCRGLTPQLANAYSASAKAGSETVVVFVSSDQNEKAFTEYYGEMPWFALPYSARDVKDKLSKKYEVRGIPSLVVLNGGGELICKNGRAEYASFF